MVNKIIRKILSLIRPNFQGQQKAPQQATLQHRSHWCDHRNYLIKRKPTV